MSGWRARAGAAILVWGLVVGFAYFIERPPHLVVDGAAVCAVLTVVWLLTDTIELAEPPDWSLYHSSSPDRTFDPRFSRLSQELSDASDRRAASVAVHDSLDAVADRILLDKYDVDRSRDSQAARTILGEQVFAYLEAPPGSEKMLFSPALSDVLDRLESL
ncbi:MAG: hypothetical protein WKF54_11705 [Nocardioidaceae bacterium]